MHGKSTFFQYCEYFIASIFKLKNLTFIQQCMHNFPLTCHFTEMKVILKCKVKKLVTPNK